MKKTFFAMMFLFFWSLSCYFHSNLLMSLSLFFSYSSLDLFPLISFHFIFDFWFLCFLLMVSIVTSLVVLYSEAYMEHYNVPKFFFLLLLFFFTMLLLSSSSSFLVLMMGWDGLGVTSICLIMFYPNKTTMFNSILTMLFNRFGDLLMIFLICASLFNFSDFFFLLDNYFCLALVMFCSFSKSAQFPLSCWLPAAMSAPTPISAMVHSSTLVTAGIFLINKFLFSFFSYSMLLILFCFSGLTFLLGGLMANLEFDFKKVVAFSTMSQISMIILFLSVLSSCLAFFHMLIHAFFKTLLFCCSGFFFIYKFGEQLKMNIHFLFPSSIIEILFLSSIFSMSGFLFSSSFFSKDVALELLMDSNSLLKFFLLVIGSLFTVFYCSKLLSSFLNSSINKTKSEATKKYSFPFLIFFLLLIILFGKLIMYNFLDLLPFCPSNFVCSLVFFIFLATTIILVIKNHFLLYFSNTVGLMKFLSFSSFRSYLNFYFSLSLAFNDNLFFKSSNFSFLPILVSSKEFHFSKSAYCIFFIVLLIFLL